MKIASTVVAVAAVALSAAGCGSKSPTTTSSLSSSFQSAVSQAYKFAACMRDHGLTNFPDPKVINKPGQQGIGIADVIHANDPRARAAQKACGGILPAPSKADLAAQASQRRAHAKDLLSFARCIRGRGVNGFPDPNAQGNITPQMLSSAGVDIHAPQFTAAALACVPASNGAITRAQVAQATSGGG